MPLNIKMRIRQLCLLNVVLVLAAPESNLSANQLNEKSSEKFSTTISVPELISVEAGTFIKGSDNEEREYAYQLDEVAYQHSVTRDRKWYAREPQREQVQSAAFQISKNLITNAQYLEFVVDTGHSPPTMDEATWKSYRLVHPFSRAQRYIWENGTPNVEREQHPVVLVSYHDATAFAQWLSNKTGDQWRLPSIDEWERAARGDEGWYFPWGNEFDEAKLNSHDKGPFDTQPVGLYPEAASPHGLLDAAGQVFEWMQTESEQNRAWVKGGSWDDKGCGVCRSAARHTRPKDIKHILVGFRVVRER